MVPMNGSLLASNQVPHIVINWDRSRLLLSFFYQKQNLAFLAGQAVNECFYTSNKKCRPIENI